MTNDLGERLRRAKPAPALEARPPDEALLSQILATRRPRRRLSQRRGAALVAAGVVVIGGLAAAASKFAPTYFGADDQEPGPAVVVAQLRSLSAEERGIEGGLGEVDEEALVRLASFETANGRATVYAAPRRAGPGFCAVDTLDDEISGGWCGDPIWKAVPSLVHHSSRWGEVVLLLGPLEPSAASIDVHFEDGTVRTARRRGVWWIYVVGGEETEAGRRPTELIARDQSGAVLATEAIDVTHFFASRTP